MYPTSLSLCVSGSLIALTLITSPLLAPSTLAGDLTEFSAPASGADMWTGIMARQGMFSPHADDCQSGEEFIQVFTDQYGVDLGFCIEESEREGLATWTAARDACLADKMRLPEPGEYHFACVNGTSVTYMEDNWEWASNFSSNAVFDSGSPRDGVSAPAMGNGSCPKATTGWFASSDATEAVLAYRCVR
ncbi:MAG: hypothetical protein RIB43_14715 [Rhodospirillaceae bacterium]